MFGIDLALLAGLGGFVATLVIGAPLTRALAEPEGWQARARRAKTPPRDRSVVTAGFTPLDLGDDPMQWPSERPWPPGVASPPWPSQTWDDEHFGSFWRGDKAPIADPGADDGAPIRRDARALPRPRSESRRPDRTSKTAAPRREARPSDDSARGAARSGGGRAPAPSPRTPEPVGLPAVEPPPRAELEQLIGSIGLAGTVQTIMQRTGWDFRKAAHYLAKIRQGG